MSKEYSREIAEAINSYLVNDDWKFEFDQEFGVFRFDLTIKEKINTLQYLIIVSENEYNIYATMPIKASTNDPEQMKKISEFINRANYGLRDGNFEIDFHDGSIRYKCYANCRGILPSTEIIRKTIHCPAAMFRRYTKGILQIFFGDMSAEDAVALCEESSSQLTEMLRKLREDAEKADEGETEDKE